MEVLWKGYDIVSFFFYLFFCTSVYIESITASSVFRYFAMETGLILDGVTGCFPLFESGKRRARKKIKFQCGQKAIQKQNIKIENVVRPTMEIAHSSLSLSRPLPLSVSSSLGLFLSPPSLSHMLEKRFSRFITIFM